MKYYGSLCNSLNQTHLINIQSEKRLLRQDIMQLVGHLSSCHTENLTSYFNSHQQFAHKCTGVSVPQPNSSLMRGEPSSRHLPRHRNPRQGLAARSSGAADSPSDPPETWPALSNTLIMYPTKNSDTYNGDHAPIAPQAGFKFQSSWFGQE
jgi:hypothetical protein